MTSTGLGLRNHLRRVALPHDSCHRKGQLGDGTAVPPSIPTKPPDRATMLMPLAASDRGDYEGFAETPAHPKSRSGGGLVRAFAEGPIACVRVDGSFKDDPVIRGHEIPSASSSDAPNNSSASSSREDRREQ